MLQGDFELPHLITRRNERFSLQRELIHVFISYRFVPGWFFAKSIILLAPPLSLMVASLLTGTCSDSAEGNGLSTEIYKAVRALSLDLGHDCIPSHAWGTWPRFAREVSTLIHWKMRTRIALRVSPHFSSDAISSQLFLWEVQVDVIFFFFQNFYPTPVWRWMRKWHTSRRVLARCPIPQYGLLGNCYSGKALLMLMPAYACISLHNRLLIVHITHCEDK